MSDPDSDAALHANLEARIRACADARDYDQATRLALQGYGPELLRFIAAMTRDDATAADVFSRASEDIWRGLPGMAWQSTFRTWAFTLTRHACYRHLRGPKRRPASLSQTDIEGVVAAVRTATLPYLRTEMKDRFRQLRESLSLEEQELLTLRIDRAFEWGDIAEIVAGGPLQSAARSRASAACRKRFERITDKLRELAEAQGLLEPER
jgi:RNA polymerase sigma-70 factor (ECF subfamily)